MKKRCQICGQFNGTTGYFWFQSISGPRKAHFCEKCRPYVEAELPKEEITDT